MAKIGDTVRLTAAFHDWFGQVVIPEQVSLKFYDKFKREMGEVIIVAPLADGTFMYDYTIPDNPPSPIYFEYSGELDQKPAVRRGMIETNWI